MILVADKYVEVIYIGIVMQSLGSEVMLDVEALGYLGCPGI